MLWQLTTPSYLSEVIRPQVVAVADGNLSNSQVVLASLVAVLLGVRLLQGDTGKGAISFTLSGPHLLPRFLALFSDWSGALCQQAQVPVLLSLGTTVLVVWGVVCLVVSLIYFSRRDVLT